MCALLFATAPTQGVKAKCIDDPLRYAGAVRTIVSLQPPRRQEAIAFFLHHRITLATQLFQLWPVEYRDLPTDVTDDTELVQLAGGFGDPFTAHAEHVGDELLGHGQVVG